MREIILDLLLRTDDTVNFMILLLSAITGVLSFLKEIHILSNEGKRKKTKSPNKGVWACIFIVSLIVCMGALTRSKLTRVPDVVGKTYNDATHILSDHHLKYTLVVDNGLYIVEQIPSAGTPVLKGEKIELIAEPIGTNPEVREKWENSIHAEYGNVAVSFKDQEITLVGEDGETISCFGAKISDFKVAEAYLFESDSGVKYDDYNVENGALIFRRIPQGVNFTLYVRLEGYKEDDTEIMLSSQNMVEGTFSFSWGMEKINDSIVLPATFYVANASKSKMTDVEYMGNVKLWVRWPYSDSWRGDYYTNADGRFGNTILINKDCRIGVKIIDPFDNGKDYECGVNLYAMEMGKAIDNEIIFLNKDGNCEVISESEYFEW